MKRSTEDSRLKLEHAKPLKQWMKGHRQHLRNKLLNHKAFIEIYGEDMPEIRDWKWKG